MCATTNKIAITGDFSESLFVINATAGISTVISWDVFGMANIQLYSYVTSYPNITSTKTKQMFINPDLNEFTDLLEATANNAPLSELIYNNKDLVIVPISFNEPIDKNGKFT